MTVGNKCVPRLLKRKGWNIPLFHCFMFLVRAAIRRRPSHRDPSHRRPSHRRPSHGASPTRDDASPTRDDASPTRDDASPNRRPRKRVPGLLQQIRTTTLPLRAR